MLVPFPPPEDALAYPYSEAEERAGRPITAGARSSATRGNRARQQLEALAERYGVEEIVVADHHPRFRSAANAPTTLLAEAFGLTPPEG